MAMPLHGVKQGSKDFQRWPVAAARAQHHLAQLGSAPDLPASGFLFFRVRAPQCLEERFGFTLRGLLRSPI